MPQLTDADYKDRKIVREADLRRHLLAQAKVEDKCSRADDSPDPRFTIKTAEFEKKGIKDFQLYYAISTLKRLALLRGLVAPQQIAQNRSPGRPCAEAVGRRHRATSQGRGSRSAIALILPLALLAGRLWIGIFRRACSVRNVLVAALRAHGCARTGGACVHRARGKRSIANLDSARRPGDRGFRRNRRLSCRRGIWNLEGFTTCTALCIGGG